MKRAIISIIFMVVVTTVAMAQSGTEFCKKWLIEGYIYLGMTFSPEEKEQGDYIQFNPDSTFISVDEGEPDSGRWEWVSEKKIINLYDEESDEPLPMYVVKVTEKKLILELKDDKESIKIKFKAEK